MCDSPLGTAKPVISDHGPWQDSQPADGPARNNARTRSVYLLASWAALIRSGPISDSNFFHTGAMAVRQASTSSLDSSTTFAFLASIMRCLSPSFNLAASSLAYLRSEEHTSELQ